MNLAARSLLIALVGCCLASAQLSAQFARTIDAGGGLFVHQIGDRAQIREPGGVSDELVLPKGGTLYRLRHLEGGWIGAGVIEDDRRAGLFLLRSLDGERSAFVGPPNPSGVELRGDPVPMVQAGQLVGLAWMEGATSRETAVHAARWDGSGWSEPEVVGRRGPGTQIGLDGVVLADGTWLLAWSGYDGSDDEILWSRRSASGWSEPLPLHPGNEAPDIVPSLLETARGALVAWSESDGRTYRVRLAELNGARWRMLPLEVTAGSLRPRLTRGSSISLLYRTVVPPTWTLVELDERGRATRRASLPAPTAYRPGLVPADDGPAVFEWPGVRFDEPARREAPWGSPP